MTQGKRPGGLTALAVLNFVFGGLGALGLLALFALLGVAKGAGAELSSAPGSGIIYVSLLLGTVSVILLITSGVGYIKQKAFLGRKLGNLYAVTSLTNTALAIGVMQTGVGIGTIIGLIYPVLTLILLNTTFREDLLN